MKERLLGQTGLKVSELGFGCIPIIRLSKNDAVHVLRHALDRGITFYDTANMYKDSEEKLGLAFDGMRDKVVLATKTGLRDGKGAMLQLENSLRMMRTDYIDLYQLHQISKASDWEKASAPGGVMEAVSKAKEQGKIRHIGVTSHSLAMAIQLVKTGLFSTVQFPFNFIEEEAAKELHPLANGIGMGVLVMKPFAGGVINDPIVVFKYLRQFPKLLVIPGFDSVEGVDEICAMYERPNKVNDDDLAAMERFRIELGKKFCRRCEYCQPCPQGVPITMAMGYQVIASRMSPKVAVEFTAAVMEAVPRCVECGLCVTRCPYDLPIPEMIKHHHDMWMEHRNSLSAG